MTGDSAGRIISVCEDLVRHFFCGGAHADFVEPVLDLRRRQAGDLCWPVPLLCKIPRVGHAQMDECHCHQRGSSSAFENSVAWIWLSICAGLLRSHTRASGPHHLDCSVFRGQPPASNSRVACENGRGFLRRSFTACFIDHSRNEKSWILRVPTSASATCPIADVATLHGGTQENQKGQHTRIPFSRMHYCMAHTCAHPPLAAALMIVFTSYSFFDENSSVLSLPLSRSLTFLSFSSSSLHLLSPSLSTLLLTCVGNRLSVCVCCRKQCALNQKDVAAPATLAKAADQASHPRLLCWINAAASFVTTNSYGIGMRGRSDARTLCSRAHPPLLPRILCSVSGSPIPLSFPSFSSSSTS